MLVLVSDVFNEPCEVGYDIYFGPWVLDVVVQYHFTLLGVGREGALKRVLERVLRDSVCANEPNFFFVFSPELYC